MLSGLVVFVSYGFACCGDPTGNICFPLEE
jgi:hypothetical protein